MTSSHLCGKVQEWLKLERFMMEAEFLWRSEGRQSVEQLACGCCRGCGGRLCMDGWEPVDLYAHNNFIIVNNHIIVIVWLNHLYSLQ